LNVNNSIKLVERQTYVDLILRDKNIWRGELMEISAQIEKETISFLTSEQSIDKQQHKAHISYLIKKMQTRLSTKDKYPTHKELLLTLKQLDNFVKGINDHDFKMTRKFISIWSLFIRLHMLFAKKYGMKSNKMQLERYLNVINSCDNKDK